uniref:Uncharacterized protein n=1 Tax=Hyaloperonospora arabidopsidis (strain Emoy2) TaxID=559515 RepID=M4BPA8_HYAAE
MECRYTTETVTRYQIPTVNEYKALWCGAPYGDLDKPYNLWNDYRRKSKRDQAAYWYNTYALMTHVKLPAV